MPNKKPLTGSLLAAMPTLLDPCFRRSILFLAHHEHDEGAMGLILNRPSGLTLGELGDDRGHLAEIPVYEGGPVERQHLLFARLSWLPTGARLQSLGEEDLERDSVADPLKHRDLKAFSGYAGWSAGQLEREITEKSWLILPPTPELIAHVGNTEEGVSRWRSVMRRLGPLHRLLAEAPDDPSLN